MWRFVNRNRIWFVLISLLILTLIVIEKLVNNYFTPGGLTSIDRSINQAIISFRTPFLNKIMLLVTLTGNWQMIVWGSLLVSFYLIIIQKKHYFTALVLSDISALVFIVVVKNLISRIRPPIENALIIEHGFAFPSGHAYFGVVFYGLLTYFLIKYLSKRWQKISISLFGTIYVLILAFSRIYLGVHWFTDVIASLSFGVIWLVVMFSYIDYETRFLTNKKSLTSPQLIKTSLIFFIAIWFLELFWLYQNSINTLGTKIINPISNATTETTSTAPAAKSRAIVVSE